MALLDDILVWTQTLPEWQQDAARRLFQKPDGLSGEDYDALYLLLKAAHGLPTCEGTKAVPLSKAHLPVTVGPKDTVTLKALRDLEHVNCIAPNQVLPFKSNGMTVVYGGNGSGKSGYARVMKRACRARDQNEEVLPNANDAAERYCIPEATFDVEIGGCSKEVSWSAKADPPEELGSVAVFDRHCARVYLTEEQEAAYLPYGLDIVEALANKVLPELARRLDQEISGINTDAEQFAHLQGDTEVGRLLEGLSHETNQEELNRLASLSKQELERLADLNRTLGDTDPATTAKRLRLSAGRLKELAERVDSALAAVDNEAIGKLKQKVREAREADNAEREAAKLLHSGEKLLPGTGESAWKALFEAARSFSVKHAYADKPFPYTEDDALCPLCQQPLRDAAERMRRFEKYVQDDVAKTAVRKRQALTEVVAAIKQATLVVGVEGAIADELDQLDAAVRPRIIEFEKRIEERRSKAIEAVSSSNWDDVPELTDNPRKAIRALAARQYRSAREYERASDRAKVEKLRKEREILNARKTLASCVKQVLLLLDRIKKKHSLEACRKSVNSRSISLKSRELASAAVTDTLREALDGEFSKLEMGHIRTKLRVRNERGRLLHQLVLDVPVTTEVQNILSEGEQGAIALGSFLAELRLANHSGPIVFDDPVSSLDHKRRRRVAERLASESLARQVIIFTHDIVFLNELQAEHNALGEFPGLRFLEKIGGQAGAVQEGLPWDHKTYKAAIDSLEQAQKGFEKMPWPAEPDSGLALRMRAKYNLLRAAIERVVQDFVLNGTVVRFRDYIMVSNLDKVVGLEASEVKRIQKLYTRCHGVVTSHDCASVKDELPPSAEEFGQDICELKSIIEAIRSRRAS